MTAARFSGNAVTATDITAAALASFRSLRNFGYAGPIIVFGLVSIDDSASGSTSKIAYVEQAVADAVAALRRPERLVRARAQ